MTKSFLLTLASNVNTMRIVLIVDLWKYAMHRNPPSPPPPVVAALDSPPRIDSAQLLRGQRTVEIEHGDQRYTLRVTRESKLILTK